MIKINMGDLEDIDIQSKLPANNDVLTYDGTKSKWVPKTPVVPSVGATTSVSYAIELKRWNIKNDGTDSAATTKGINDALSWANSQGYNHVLLPIGTYLLKINSTSFSCILMYSDMNFQMEEGCILQLETNSSPWYRVFDVKGVTNAKITGGQIIGDKKTHIYQLNVKFVRGGVNADGSLNNNAKFIRSEIVDRYANPGLLSAFRLWNISGVTASTYSFYQYKDTVSSSTLVGSRTNGQFAPAAPTGRGWFTDIANCNKMIFVIDVTSSPLTDVQISQIQAKVDSQNYSHEWGHGIEITGSNNVEVENIDISNCMGDAVTTGWLVYRIDPKDYKQEEMGSHIYIHNCDLHHCRRQGISLCASNDTYIYNNKIHHIGRADDGVTMDGTSPMFGIDIESMWTETNIPTWRPELNQAGFELNTRIYIKDNYIYNNERGHLVNADGIHVVIETNIFEGTNVGGIGSYPNNWYVKYLNNTFIGCELVVNGDNFVTGSICNSASIKLADISGAVITNCKIKDGQFYGNSLYGYLGMPTVDVPSGTFSYAAPHGMGNGAQICFEQWVGKVPSGISVDTIYYTSNIKPTSFQLTDALNGKPITITDSGVSGFNISRINYGRCYISDIVVERDWRNDNTLTKNFSLIMAGGVVNNITVRNCDLDIRTPENYVGRLNVINGVTLIEGAAFFDGCNLSNSKFMRARTGRLGGDITFGNYDTGLMRKMFADTCWFQNVAVNCDGNLITSNSKFISALIGKKNNSTAAIIANSYLENTILALHWLTKDTTMTIVKCIFNNVTADANSNTKMVDNASL